MTAWRCAPCRMMLNQQRRLGPPGRNETVNKSKIRDCFEAWWRTKWFRATSRTPCQHAFDAGYHAGLDEAKESLSRMLPDNPPASQVLPMWPWSSKETPPELSMDGPEMLTQKEVGRDEEN